MKYEFVMYLKFSPSIGCFKFRLPIRFNEARPGVAPQDFSLKVDEGHQKHVVFQEVGLNSFLP